MSGSPLLASVSELPRPFGPCAVTIGNFDGVHAGHRRLIERTVEVARSNSWRAVALTFDPHPTCVLAPDRSPRLLTTLARRAELIRARGVDTVVTLPFTRETASLAPEEFARRILVDALGARAVIVGDNFRFGRGAAGHADTLQKLGAELGFTVHVIAAVRCRGRVVSSTEVRESIRNGNMTRAWRMLQRPFDLQGDVVRGAGIGSKQTAPTLNLRPTADALPAPGVYVTRTHEPETGRGWDSVTNVGYRPTFGGGELTIETFLLDPLEGETPRQIRVEFLYRLRDERKFENPEALKQQILRDVARARKFHRRAPV